MINICTHYFDTVTSTNLLLKEAAFSGAPSGTLYVAGAQTQGRGRMGRSFYSPGNTGLYMSLLIRREDLHYDMNLLTAQVAVSTAAVIDKHYGVKTGIKWVNDIFLHGRKIAGILCEGFWLNNNHCVVIGIGININTQNWPQDIANTAGSICTVELSVDKRIQLAEDICRNIIALLGTDDADWLIQYNERSILTDKIVEVYKIADGNEHYSAKVIGIDNQAHLLVVDENNVEIRLNSGEVRVKK